VRLAAIGLLAAALSGALYAVGRLHAPDYAASLFGQTGIAAITLKSLLATIVLGLAIGQVLLALWIYRKLPLAGRPPRPVRLSHRLIGFGLFALTVLQRLPAARTVARRPSRRRDVRLAVSPERGT
jgi:hypothetical protein